MPFESGPVQKHESRYNLCTGNLARLCRQFSRSSQTRSSCRGTRTTNSPPCIHCGFLIIGLNQLAASLGCKRPRTLMSESSIPAVWVEHVFGLLPLQEAFLTQFRRFRPKFRVFCAVAGETAVCATHKCYLKPVRLT